MSVILPSLARGLYLWRSLKKAGDDTELFNPEILDPSDEISYNATTVYGARIIHNTILGMGTDPQIPRENFPLDYFEKFALRSGLYISTHQDVPFPNAMGEVVDGNVVTNTPGGLQLSNTSWYTALRNNSVTGNKFDVRGVEESVETTELNSTGATPGVKTLAPINKSALYDITITSVSNGNGQADINFAIKSANGKGYTTYLSETGAAGSFKAYSDVNYNAKGAHVKGLTNGKTYYFYVEYKEGTTKQRSDVATLEPSK